MIRVTAAESLLQLSVSRSSRRRPARVKRKISPAPLDTTLLEIGAESLDFVDLVHKLERSFEIAIPWSLSIPGSQTVRSFVDAVATGLADRKASGQQPGILDHCDG